MRYELYKHAKTLQEYLDLHPKEVKGDEYRDFEWDFSKGHVKLLPSGALMSLDLHSRAALAQVTVGCVSTEVPLGIYDLSDNLAERIFQATATIPSLMAFRLPPELQPNDGPWDLGSDSGCTTGKTTPRSVILTTLPERFPTDSTRARWPSLSTTPRCGKH